MLGKLLANLFSILDTFFQNSRDAELKADGARKGELERRDEQDKVRADAKEYRKSIANDSDDDILRGL